MDAGCFGEARQAVEEDEVPVGAVVVAAGRIIGMAHNQREQLADPTARRDDCVNSSSVVIGFLETSIASCT